MERPYLHSVTKSLLKWLLMPKRLWMRQQQRIDPGQLRLWPMLVVLPLLSWTNRLARPESCVISVGQGQQLRVRLATAGSPVNAGFLFASVVTAEVAAAILVRRRQGTGPAVSCLPPCPPGPNAGP